MSSQLLGGLAILLIATAVYGFMLLGWRGNECQATAREARESVQWIVGTRC
jgi:hypothetical protein